MTIAAYQTLYESSVAFGMRKALMAEQGKADMERKVNIFKEVIYLFCTKPLSKNRCMLIKCLKIVYFCL